MKKTKTIDLTAMPTVHIDEETNAFRPNWDNTILMTAYDPSRTFVLTWDGRHLLIDQPLREVLSRFADDNDIAEYERQALYDLVGVRKGRGYVAGHHRLVPTHGTTNADVVYYMAHHLAGDVLQDDQVVASFRGRKRVFRVQIDTSITTFEGLLEAANQVAECQLAGLDWIMHNYGVKMIPKRESVNYYHNIREHCRQMHRVLRQAWMMAVVYHILRDYLGEEDLREILDRIKRKIKK